MEKAFVIIYQGNIEESLKKNNISKYIILNNQMAVVYTNENFDEASLNSIKEISWWQKSFTMSSLIESSNNVENGETVTTASGTSYIYNNPYIVVDGKGIIIAIIDSGIDYLHPAFINEDGTSKIISIWDQEGSSLPPPEGMIFGSEFSREDINKAIVSNDSSLTKDNIGTGTIAAGITSGNGRDNSNYKGVATKSELIVVKLREYKDTYEYGKINYLNADFLAAVKYVIDVSKKENKPTIINLTIGERARSGIEFTGLNSFDYLNNSGVIVVSGAGNEGNTDIHYEGSFRNSLEQQDIIIQVGKQRALSIIMSTNGPDKIGAMLISPSGEMSYKILYSPEYYVYRGKFNLENSSYEMRYIYPWFYSGNQELLINIYDIKPGVWTLRLYPEFIIDGEYDIYLPNKNLIASNTRFLDPNSSATITLYGSTENIITVGAYNDKTNSMWIGSSKGPIKGKGTKPDIVAPGVDIISTFINQTYNTATGTGVSSSMVSGVLALIMEYLNQQGIYTGKTLFTKVLKTYLMLGATRKDIYTYPNISQGYGILNLEETIIAIANNI
ncbi:MAG: bile acid germinant receptor pseudoprotease CspC [Romboutsia sp.]